MPAERASPLCVPVGAVLLYRIMTFKIAGTLIWILYPHLQRGQGD